MKRVISLILCILIIMTLVLSVSALSTIQLKSVKLDKSSLALDTGDTYNLKVTFTPANTTQKLLAFTTSDKNVATVDSTGKIIAVKAGSAIITVSSSNKKVVPVKCTVTVKQKLPVKIKFILPYQDEAPSESNIVVKELNAVCNSIMSIEWTPMISYNDKFNVLMASNQLPDAVLIPDPKLTIFTSGANAGMFWELTSYLKQFSELKDINPILTTNASVDGKLYMIPRERTLKRKIVIYRADWAKKAGLGAPDTIEKMYQMAKRFGNGDFDGSMVKDTIGLALGTVNNEIDCFDALVVAFGGFTKWGVKDGKVIPNYMTAEYMDTMNWLRKMYQEKLVSPDFAITKTTQVVPDLVDKDRTGLYLGYGLPGLSDAALVRMQKINPTLKRSDIYNYTYLKGPDGKERIPAETGISGGFAFPKQTVKNEARLKELLSVFNGLISEKGQILITNGVPEIHFDLLEGKYSKTKDPAVFKKEVSPIGQIGLSGNKAYIIGDDDIGIRLNLERRVMTPGMLIPDVTAPLTSKSFNTNNTRLLNIISQAQFKYIMGDIDESQWNKAVDEWLNAGGNEAINEYTAAYNKGKK